MMKHLLDEGVSGLFAANGELGDIVRAGQANRIAIIGQIIACGINWPVVFAGAETAYGVELFEAEAKRIDD